jgi:hypothetical protein
VYVAVKKQPIIFIFQNYRLSNQRRTITQYVCAQKHHNFINGIVYLQHKFKSFLYIFPLKSFGHFVVKKFLPISTKGTMTSDLNSLNTNQKRTQHTTLEIQGLNWDRHNNVVG